MSNQEAKIKEYVLRLVELEKLHDFVGEILMPTERVTEVKGGKKSTRTRKFYPGYLFVQMRLYDESGKILQKPWDVVKGANGVRGFVGGDKPVPLRPAEIQRIQDQMKAAEGVEKPKVEYTVGEVVRIMDGPFMNLTGEIEQIDPEAGKLKVSVSIFGRFTPVELEYWQVDREDS